MKKAILSICAVLISFSTFPQTGAWEAGAIFGATNYLGDIGKGAGVGRPFIADMQWKFTKPGISGFARYNVSKAISLKANLIFGSLQASDQQNNTYYGRVIRNAHFKSSIFETSLVGEFNFLRKPFKRNPGANGFDKGIRTSQKRSRRCPTPGAVSSVNELVVNAFVGLGIFRFNPKAELDGTWHSLQPLGTEGQFVDGSGLKPYSLVELTIPVGLGMYYFVPATRIKVGAELGWRKTFTDYLDDVSENFADPALVADAKGDIAGSMANRTAEISNNLEKDSKFSAPGEKRGDPDNKDSYFFMGITVSYTITTWQVQLPKYRRNRFQLFNR